jgi:hypothetical protein
VEIALSGCEFMTSPGMVSRWYDGTVNRDINPVLPLQLQALPAKTAPTCCQRS